MLLCLGHWKAGIVAELKESYELLETIDTSASPTLKARAQRSHLHHTAVRQFAIVLKDRGWVVDDTVLNMTLARFR